MMLARDQPARLAHLEPYLMEVVGPHFRQTGQLSVEDFWLILIWKANRAKNNERRRFEAISKATFAVAVADVPKYATRKETRQAEFLVHDQVPLAQVRGIGVFSDGKKKEVDALLGSLGWNVQTAVKREWYI